MQKRTDACGRVRTRADVYGRVWTLTEASMAWQERVGFIKRDMDARLSRDACGRVRTRADLYGCMWTRADAHRRIRTRVDAYGRVLGMARESGFY